MPRSHLLVGAVVGVLLGTVYALSPMTVVFCLLVALLLRTIGRGLPERERAWVVGAVAVGALLRVAVIAAGFLSADHDRVPFFVMFGDEAQIRLRSLWLRNIAWGIPLDPVYFNSALDRYGYSPLAYVAAAVQLVVGEAPYGLQLLNTLAYLTTAALLHRAARVEYGCVPAFAALVILLFLPSLFIWSVSALKEPSLYLLNALTVFCTLMLIRRRGWRRLLWGAVAVLLLWPATAVRTGAALAPAAGIVAGALAWTLARVPRLFGISVAAVIVAAWATGAHEAVERRALEQLREAARYHWGGAITPGHGYRLLDQSFYQPRLGIPGPTTLDEPQAARFVIRSLVSFVTRPWPWESLSQAEAAYIPLQMLWYVLLLLGAVGLAVGLRRHVVFTSIVAANVVAGATLVALTNGNVGTLVRTRDMVTPLICVLAGLGVCAIGRVATRSASPQQVRQRLGIDGPPLDYSGLVAAAGRHWLVVMIRRLADAVRAGRDASYASRILTAAEPNRDTASVVRRIALGGWIVAVAGATYAVLQQVTTTPAPLGPHVAAVAALVGLLTMAAAPVVARAWPHRRLLVW